jgi:hypothetical protein
MDIYQIGTEMWQCNAFLKYQLNVLYLIVIIINTPPS